MIGDVAINGTLAFGRHAAFALGVWASNSRRLRPPSQLAERSLLGTGARPVISLPAIRRAVRTPLHLSRRLHGSQIDAGKIAQFLMDPHPKMPDMQLSRDEAKDLGAYIASLAK